LDFHNLTVGDEQGRSANHDVGGQAAGYGTVAREGTGQLIR